MPATLLLIQLLIGEHDNSTLFKLHSEPLTARFINKPIKISLFINLKAVIALLNYVNRCFGCTKQLDK